MLFKHAPFGSGTLLLANFACLITHLPTFFAHLKILCTLILVQTCCFLLYYLCIFVCFTAQNIKNHNQTQQTIDDNTKHVFILLFEHIPSVCLLVQNIQSKRLHDKCVLF